MILIVALLCTLLGVFGGFWAREVRDYLRGIYRAVRSLKLRQEQQEQAAKPMSFAGPEPINMEELSDQEKIELLNM